MSTLDFKASSAWTVFLRFICGAIPADLLTVSIAATQALVNPEPGMECMVQRML